MNETIKLGLALMIIGLVASLALAFTNQFTEKHIEEQQKIALKNSLSRAMPEAKHFQEKPGHYEAYKDDEMIGRVIKVESQGYSSVLKMLVGVDLDDKIVSIDVLDQLETPGLGANVEKDEFLSQFKGKSINELKLKKDGGEIDAITGATITSRAVINGIKKAEEDCNCDEITAATKEYNGETNINESLSEIETKTETVEEDIEEMQEIEDDIKIGPDVDLDE